MRAGRRFAVVTGVVLASTAPVGRPIARRYGPQAGRRFRTAMASTLVVQQVLVRRALQRYGSTGEAASMHALTPVDVLTLSRGVAAAGLIGLMVAGIRDRRGTAGWIGWLALLYGAILCDWIDGPLARRLGTSEVGALLDLESDSWLTLCTAGAAVAWGDLPAVVLAPPALRYLLLLSALRHSSYAASHGFEPRWARPAGMLQMLLFISALAPFGGRGTWAVVRLVCPIQTPLQVAGLVAQHGRKRP